MMLETFTATLGAALIWDKVPDDYKKWLEDKFKEKAQEAGLDLWQKFQWTQAEKEYREKLAKLYGTTRILGNSEPTPLEGIFTDLYILDKPLAMRRYNIEQLQACDDTLRGHNMERKEGITVVKQANSHRLFILGKPGAGKTTFLKYVTLQAVKGELPQTPIFVSLYDWSTSNKTLMEFIVAQFEMCNFPKAESFIEYLLEKGKAILLLDGLDEVNNEHNQKVIKAVKSFCWQYDKTQCLITCRVAAADYSFEEFKYMEVADFTDAQIEIFVKKWFVKEPIKCEKFLTEFKQEQYRGVRELASSPLLLGMLCLAFADSMEFTTRRVDIYEDAIDALLRKWDTSQSISRDVIYQGLNHQLKKRVFTGIAYNTFNNKEYLVEEKKLAYYLELCLKRLPEIKNQQIDGEAFLKKIEEQHGIFVERAQKIHSFAHLTFQEYFAACAIKGNVNYQKELMKHIVDPRWMEVFLLTASLLDDADDFFDIFRTAIVDLTTKDDKLTEFLQWAECKANSIQSDYQIKDVRFSYLFLELALDPFTNFYGNSFSNLALDSGRRTLVHDLSFALTIVCNSNHDMVYASALQLHSKDIGLDYLLYHLLIFKELSGKNYSWYLEIINKFQNFDIKLTNSLLKAVAKKDSINDWKILHKKLSIFLQKQRNISKQWNFTHIQYKLLSDYFLANSLLLDCLELATVSDREAIKNSLFLPPANSTN